MFYLLVNGKHEARIGNNFPPSSSIRVCIKGLLGGGKKGVLTITFEDEDCRCWTTQSFREVAEDRGLEIKAKSLFDCMTGIEFGVDETIGEYYEPGDSPILQWETGEEEVVDHTVELHYCLKGVWKTMLVDGELILEDFMAQFHKDVNWMGFSSQEEELDTRTTLECFCDESRHLELDIESQDEETIEIESQDEEASDEGIDLWEIRRLQEVEEEYWHEEEETLEEEDLNMEEETAVEAFETPDDVTDINVGANFEPRGAVECNRGLESSGGRYLHDFGQEGNPNAHQEIADFNSEGSGSLGHGQEANQDLGEDLIQAEDSGGAGLGKQAEIGSLIPVRSMRQSSEGCHTGDVEVGDAQREDSL
jgi:hypothetical protein